MRQKEADEISLQQDDQLLLECLEDLLRCINDSLKKVQQVRSIHISRLEQWASEIKDQRRMIEEISIPARMILEHIMECKYKGAQIAVEAVQLSMRCASVRRFIVEEFGLIKVTLGELELVWRDEDYKYYFYPDKVELRAADEKSAIKLFFSLAFSSQHVGKFPQLLESPNVVYIHPQIEQWIKKGSFSNE